MLSGFGAEVLLWAWTALVVVYAFYRSVASPAADEIRGAGPSSE